MARARHEARALHLPVPVADRRVASMETGWVPVEVYSELAKSFVAGWAVETSAKGWPVVAVYELDGHVFRKFLRHSSSRIRKIELPAKGVCQFYPGSGPMKPREFLETARLLKYYLKAVAEVVAMAKRTSMCRCEIDGEKATKVMIRLCGEVQAWLQNAAGMRDTAAEETVEQVWLKVLEVWCHLAGEHLRYMLRPGYKPGAPPLPA